MFWKHLQEPKRGALVTRVGIPKGCVRGKSYERHQSPSVGAES